MGARVPLDDLPGSAQSGMDFAHPSFNEFATQVEKRYALPTGVLLAIKNAGERSGPTAVSSKGARSVMQFMPDTAKAYGVDVTDQASAIDGAGRMMADLLKQYGGNVNAAIAHYNGGTEQGKIVAQGGQPTFPETAAYLQRVSQSLPRAPVTIDGASRRVPDDDLPVRPFVDDKPIDANPANQTGTLNIAGIDTGIPLSKNVTRVLAGAGKAPSDIKLGLEQIQGRALGAVPVPLRPAAAIGQKLAQALGIMRTPDEATAEASRRAVADRPLMDTSGGFWGNVAGNVAMTAPVVGGAALSTMRTAPIVGAGLGYVQPVTGEGGDIERAINTALGGAGAAAGTAITRGLSRVISPATRAPVRQLIDEGVTPTPGQILGGPFQALEDKATSMLGVGDAITAARRRSIDDLNRSLYNRATQHLGRRVDAPVGREGVQAVREALGGAYDDLLTRLRFQADDPFNAGVANVRQMAATLPQQQAQQFERILQEQLMDRMTPQGLMSGTTLKQVESELGRLARGYGADASFDSRQLGSAIRELQNQLRQALVRSNPQAAEELAANNAAWALFARIRDAASRIGSKDGVITPASLAGAVRAGDRTVGHGGYATGSALLQDVSDAAVNVLTQKVPNSGTVDRLLVQGPLIGAAGYLEPATLAAMGAGAAAYTPAGQRIMMAILAQRPDLAPQIAQMVRSATAITAPAGAAGLLNLAE